MISNEVWEKKTCFHGFVLIIENGKPVGSVFGVQRVPRLGRDSNIVNTFVGIEWGQKKLLLVKSLAVLILIQRWLIYLSLKANCLPHRV